MLIQLYLVKLCFLRHYFLYLTHAQRTKSIKEPSSSYRLLHHHLGSSSMTVPLPIDAQQRISRSLTSVTRSAHTRDGPQPTSVLDQTGISTSHHRSLSKSHSPLISFTLDDLRACFPRGRVIRISTDQQHHQGHPLPILHQCR